MANPVILPLPLSAKNCVVVLSGVPYYGGMKWQATPESAMLDTSNFYGQGFEDQIAGLRKLDVHIEGWYDSANCPYDAPLNLQDGQVVSFILYTNLVGSPNWIGSGLVKGQPMIADVHGRVDVNVDLKAKGQFVSPSLTTSTTTTTTTFSDLRVKESTEPCGSVDLTVYEYNYIGSSERFVGLMAQEVYEVYPQAVIRGGEDPWTEPWLIDYAKLFRLMGPDKASELSRILERA